jgi:hypothetical protein
VELIGGVSAGVGMGDAAVVPFVDVDGAGLGDVVEAAGVSVEGGFGNRGSCRLARGMVSIKVYCPRM